MFKEKTNESHSINASKMSYFSDIDLATLHRSRLNERIQYKLSWFNRRQKYYIPPTGNQTATPTPIKTYTNSKFNSNHKKAIPSCQSSNVSSEHAKSSNKAYNNNNCNNHKSAMSTTATTTTTTAKIACNGKQKSQQMPIDQFKRDSNHYDNSTEDAKYGQRDKLTILKRTHLNSKSDENMAQIAVTNNCMKNKLAKNTTLFNHTNKSNKSSNTFTTTCASSSCISLASGDLDSQKSNASHSTVHEKCLSTETINRNTNNMSNHMGNIPFPCSETANAQQAAIEEDLKLPHRKRSGTWP